MTLRRFTRFLFVGAAVIGLAGPAAAQQCVVGVTSGGGGLELPQLQNSLIGLGFNPVVIVTPADATAANANVIVDRYDSTNLTAPEATTWLNSGKGYVQLGDWAPFFPESFVSIAKGAPVAVSVTDALNPLAAGLPASWTGRGFWVYGAGTDYIDSASNGALPDVLHAVESSNTYTRVATTQLVGTGRAAFIGINVYGTAAGVPDLRLLSNAVTWAGACSAVSVPTVSGVGLAVLGALLAFAGMALILRLR